MRLQVVIRSHQASRHAVICRDRSAPWVKRLGGQSDDEPEDSAHLKIGLSGSSGMRSSLGDRGGEPPPEPKET